VECFNSNSEIKSAKYVSKWLYLRSLKSFAKYRSC